MTGNYCIAIKSFAHLAPHDASELARLNYERQSEGLVGVA